MKIALLGYGRMGKEIEKIALERGHEIVLKVQRDESYDISIADVAIDFSVPSAAFQNISNGIQHKVPVVSGTTGWLAQYNDAVALCNAHEGAFIYASNFSLGVNLFFDINAKVAQLLSRFDTYSTAIEEIHHTQKLDAPSGTAISLAEGIIANSNKKEWSLDGTASDTNIPITAKRIPEVPGTHTISYTSSIDTISLTHTAHNRSGFALGAVVAAEWILGKKGVFTMKDVLNLG